MLRSWYARIIGFSVKHAALVVTLTFAVTLVFGYFALKVRINPDFISFLPQNAEVNRVIKEYGSAARQDDILVLAVVANGPGADVFDAGMLAAFGQAVQEISALPGVLSTISPFNLVSFGREDGRLDIRPMSAGGSAPAPEAAQAFKERLAGARYAKNLVVSADSKMLIAYFEAEHEASFQPFMTKVDRIVAGLKASGLTSFVTGTIPVSVQTGSYLSLDLGRLLALAALIIVACYIAGFRSFRGIVIPLLSVLFGTLWTVGFMGIAGFSLSLISVVAPPLIMIFGNEYNIYATSEIRRLATSDGPRNGLIERASSNIAKPLAMAVLTTLVGFLSLTVTEIRQTREFALTACFGSLACAVLAQFFLPAFFALVKPLHAKQRRASAWFANAMRNLAGFTFRFPAVALGTLVIVIVLFVLSWPKLVFNTDSGSYYPSTDRVLLDTYAIYGKVGGYEEISVSFDAPEGAPGFFLDAATLAKVDSIERELRAIPDISYSISLPALLRDINLAATGIDELPANRAVISMFARLLSAAGTSSARGSILGNLTNKDFTRLTISFRILNADTGRYMDEARFRALVNRMRKVLDENPVGAKAVLWGDLMRILSFADSLRRSLFTSMAISIVSILALTIFVFRSFLFGLYPLVPLLAGLLVNYIVMAVAGIPLDMTTIMVSNIAIGVGVDSAIYLVIQYRRELSATPSNPQFALGQTLSIMGQPVLLSSLSIVAGLLVFVAATFRPVLYFGVLVMVTLLATTLGTLVTLPTLLGIDARARQARSRRLPRPPGQRPASA
jgi:predicted RND superfamily exporter protein